MEIFLKKAVDTVPHPRQINWQSLEFTSFVHFGMNTFSNREWGDGKEDPAIFNPTALDTDQWCEVLHKAGIKACIVTAKHHDGFCLWDTKYTDHCVKNSPCKEDIVAKVSKSCKKYGIKLGIYLSPWDRHESTYGFGDAYDDYFCNQLTELLSSYGEVYTVWFDGACGEGTNGKKQVYNWERYYEVIRRLQPNAVISVCGPDVRWCGNEAGACRSSEWSVVPAYMCDNEKTHENSQQADDEVFREKGLDSSAEDLGSRAVLEKAKSLIWYPAEVDTSIRPGWFYHEAEDDKVRSLDTLKTIYLNSVGGNCVLLLNIPPNTKGLISDADSTRLIELGNFINEISSVNLASDADITASSTEAGYDISGVLKKDESYWKAKNNTEACEITIKLPKQTTISYVTIMEQIEESQRIEGFTLHAKVNGSFESIYTGTTVGYKKICPLKPISTDEIKLCITASRFYPTIKHLAFS